MLYKKYKNGYPKHIKLGVPGATGGFSRPVPSAEKNRRCEAPVPHINRRGRSPHFTEQVRLMQTHERRCRAMCEALTSDCYVPCRVSPDMCLQAHSGAGALQAQSKPPAQPWDPDLLTSVIRKVIASAAVFHNFQRAFFPNRKVLYNLYVKKCGRSPRCNKENKICVNPWSPATGK